MWEGEKGRIGERENGGRIGEVWGSEPLAYTPQYLKNLFGGWTRRRDIVVEAST
jgi:hypothetical protein